MANEASSESSERGEPGVRQIGINSSAVFCMTASLRKHFTGSQLQPVIEDLLSGALLADQSKKGTGSNYRKLVLSLSTGSAPQVENTQRGPTAVPSDPVKPESPKVEKARETTKPLNTDVLDFKAFVEKQRNMPEAHETKISRLAREHRDRYTAAHPEFSFNMHPDSSYIQLVDHQYIAFLPSARQESGGLVFNLNFVVDGIKMENDKLCQDLQGNPCWHSKQLGTGRLNTRWVRAFVAKPGMLIKYWINETPGGDVEQGFKFFIISDKYQLVTLTQDEYKQQFSKKRAEAHPF